MISTILAVIIAAYALGFTLFVVKSLKERPGSYVARSGRVEDFVTRDELKVAIEHNAQEFEFMTNEWYEKFNALHQRLAKREKRAADPNQEPQLKLEQGRTAPPSVRDHYLRRG